MTRTREYDADSGTVTNLEKTSCATRCSRDIEATKKVARELEIRHASTETQVGCQVAFQKNNRAKQRARRHSSTATEIHRRTRHVPHDTNIKRSSQFRRLVQRRLSPRSVRCAPSPQVGFSVHPGQLTKWRHVFGYVCTFDAMSVFSVLRVAMSERS